MNCECYFDSNWPCFFLFTTILFRSNLNLFRWFRKGFQLLYFNYNHSINKRNCGTAPRKNPRTSSLKVWAFISNLEDAIMPLSRISVVIVAIFWIRRCKLNPIIKIVKELMAIMWRLALTFINNSIKANNVLKRPANKKKCNSG